ncbi:hypothetical protein OSB04_018154 [Centaurea solstitialis]|uniref:Reverse transcriptase domain-containing protein n=1 Tax=Centaurea solstitialis TaxID=347529 RepID=A0AA38T5Y3_9ASTR|nr:hypothetical protein OSB04_018154 [Centaurea solstitialis]
MAKNRKLKPGSRPLILLPWSKFDPTLKYSPQAMTYQRRDLQCRPAYKNDRHQLELPRALEPSCSSVVDNVNEAWRLTGFYGFPERNRRRDSWNFLRSLADNTNQPWVVIGDFNDLLAQEEKRGPNAHPEWCIQGFRETLSNCRLTDLSMHGFPFTWCRHRGKPNEIYERLDRAVGNIQWLNLFPEYHVENLVSPISDHSPIALHTQMRSPSPISKRFRFENKWLHEDTFDNFFLQSWTSPENSDFLHKLSKLAKDLHKWGRNLNSSFKKEIKEANSKLNVLRESPDQFAAAAYEEERTRLIATLLKEEEHWRQRAKAHWLKEGDLNTKFFHAYANGRRKTNQILKLKDDNGNWVKDPSVLRNLVKGHFNRIYSAYMGNPEEITRLVKNRLSPRELARLDLPFTKEEFRRALFQMHPDKSPGPDGFNPRFFQKKWEFLGDEIFNTGKSWLENGILPPGVNDTVIALIPKVNSPSSLKEYRPIALCNVILKIITKVLANRIKPILPNIISANQTAFVKDRLITDNIIIAFEMLHSMQRNTRKKSGEVAIKIDISKAYDRLSWVFLRQMLSGLGFPTRWIKMIMMTVESVHYFVKVNNELVGPITPKRGIRQGDPLSPYLFIICMEGLSTYMDVEESAGRIHGCKAARGAPSISHLFFADDAFFFCKASIDEIRHLKFMLTTYEEASGQAINYEKSGIMGSNNLAPELMHGVSHILGIVHPINTDRYLGLPSLVGRSKKSIFRHIRDKLWTKIQRWNKNPLSSAGKSTLIKAAAQAIPAYYMNVFLLPVSTLSTLERMINSFWWSRKSDGPRSINWLSWDKLCTPLNFGGLGFRDFTAFNLAMLGKQGWRLVLNSSSLVSRILKAKYYPKKEFLEAQLGHSPSYIWRSIWHSQLALQKGIRWKVGNGRSINIWKDPWLRDDEIFTVESPLVLEHANMTVGDLVNPLSQEWNRELLARLFSSRDCNRILNLSPPNESHPDKIIWHWTEDGIYSVKSCYRLITEKIAPLSHLFISGDWKRIWKANIPNKVKFFIWRAIREVIPTRNALQSRGIQVPPLCPLCNRNVENNWHALVDCPQVRSIWNETGLSSEIDARTLEANSFSELIFKFLHDHSGHDGDSFLMLLWSIWHRRNDIVWNDGPRDPSPVIRRAFCLLSEWRAKRSLTMISSGSHDQPNTDSWKPPRPDFLKCNVDATVPDNNSSAGFGAVIRNHKGEFIAAKATPISSRPPVRECEALAIRDTILWVANRGESNVVFETDAKVVADAIYDPIPDDSEFGDIIKDIRSLLNANMNFSVHAVSRQANEVAHLMARRSRFLTCPLVFHVTPDFLISCMNTLCNPIPINETNEALMGDGNAEAH